MKDYLNKPTGSQPFKTPEGYFSELENKILHSTINKKNGNPFTVPDRYFDELESSIADKIVPVQKSINHKKIIPLFNKKIYWTSIAACLVIFIGLGINYFNQTEQADNTKIVKLNKTNNDSSVNNSIDNKYINMETKEKEESDNLKASYIDQPMVSGKQIKKTSKTLQNKSEMKNNYEEKTSEVIYSLYFEDTSDDTYLTSEDEFFL